MDKILDFYNVKTKQKFTSSEYEIKQRSGKYFAVTKPEGTYECWRVLSKKMADELK